MKRTPTQDDRTRYAEIEAAFSDPGSSTKNPRTLVLPYSSVTDDAADTGKLFVREGLFLGLNPDSDADAVLRVGLDDDPSCQFRLRRGTVLHAPNGRPFKQIYLMRPSKVPNDATKTFILDVFWDPSQVTYALDAITVGAAPGAKNETPGQVAVTGAATALVAARAQRRTVAIHNGSLAGVNLFLGGSTVTILTGLKLLPGTTVFLDTTAALYAIGDAAGPTRASFMELFD